MPIGSWLRLPALRTGLLGRLILAFALVVLFVFIANKAVTNGGTILRVSEHRQAAPIPAAVPTVARVEPKPDPHQPDPIA